MRSIPSSCLRHRFLLLLCIVAASPVWGDDNVPADATLDTPAPSTNHQTDQVRRPFPTQLLYDTKYVLTSPTRWDSQDWAWFGATAAAVIGTGALIDKRESDAAADREHTLDKVATKLEPFGAQYSFFTLAGFYGGGKLFDSPRAVAVAEDGFTASVIAAGIISPVIKWAVGRVRPANTADRTEFHPFGHNHSFPSGHTTQAFSVASVIAAHYDSAWIDTAAYTTASLVGYARHQHQAHWASDIVAGAALGIAVGHTVVKLNDENRGTHVSLEPSDNGPMVALVVPFD